MGRIIALSPAGKEILTCLHEGNTSATIIHQRLRDSGYLISRDETYDQLRDLNQRGLIEATSGHPAIYRITQNGRLMLD